MRTLGAGHFSYLVFIQIQSTKSSNTLFQNLNKHISGTHVFVGNNWKWIHLVRWERGHLGEYVLVNPFIETLFKYHFLDIQYTCLQIFKQHTSDTPWGCWNIWEWFPLGEVDFILFLFLISSQTIHTFEIFKLLTSCSWGYEEFKLNYW